MIMDNMKNSKSGYPIATTYNGFDDRPSWWQRETIASKILPLDADKWITHLNNEELFKCYLSASLQIYHDPNFILSKEIGHDDTWYLFCGEFFDAIKDKVVEKQAYLVKNFNLEIEDEEIKSEVDDYLKRNKC